MRYDLPSLDSFDRQLPEHQLKDFMPMTKIYLSAVNIKDGGPLTILNSIVRIFLDVLPPSSELHIITNPSLEKSNRALFQNPKIHLHVFNWPLRGGGLRLLFEYVYLPFYMRGRGVDIWFSLNDVSTFVAATKRCVYFHNPSPFIPLRLFSFFPVSFLIYGLFYNLLYFINSRNYDHVFVQQRWMGDVVSSRYGLHNVLVARPASLNKTAPESGCRQDVGGEQVVRFIYPAFPRFTKNHDVIINAVQKLKKSSAKKFEVIFTLDGSENEYSNNILSICKSINEIKFVGILDAMGMRSLYEKSDVLIFPSLLETWGLPISEAMGNGLTLFLSNLPYAHEVVGAYSKSYFFEPTDATQLAELMKARLELRLHAAPAGAGVNSDLKDLNDLVSFVLKGIK